MRKLLALALVASAPVYAASNTCAASAVYTGCSVSLAAVGDTLVLPVTGDAFATVNLSFVAQAGSPTVTLGYSIDGGVNYLASGSGAPYTKRTDAVSANPTVKAFATIQTTGAESWEFPLGGNVTHVRVIVTTAGTAQAVTLAGGKKFQDGVPVTATLYDVTSAVNTAIDTGILDVSGWTIITHLVTNPAGGAGQVSFVDDAGSTVQSLVTFGAGVTVIGSVGAGGVLGGTASGSAATAQVGLPKRLRYQTNAVAALTSRVHLEARR